VSVEPGYCIRCGLETAGGDDFCPACAAALSSSAGRTRSRPAAEPAREEVWQPGRTVAGLYEVKGLLGRGAFGEVWLVRHRNWGMDLAVKTPRAAVVASEEKKRRFLREAERWVGLDRHRNIAIAYYVKEIAGWPRIFVEYVDGGSLRDWLAQGKVKEWKTVLRIAVEICEAMAYAHSRGLAHLDLKPENVLLTREGEVRITDFGLARRTNLGAVERVGGLGPAGGAAGSWADGVAGTPPYMAPEQWEGRAGREADVYAFGCILFEMACGRRPYQIPESYRDAMEVFKVSLYRKMHCTEPVPDPRLYGCPGKLASLIQECLKKDPKERPAGFGSLKEELIAIYRELVGSPYPSPDPGSLSLKADDLNNKAVSLLVLGRKHEARRCFEEAARTDPHHLLATYNLGLLQWREGEITGETFLGRLKGFADPEGRYLRAVVRLERGELEDAMADLEGALKARPQEPSYCNAMGLVLFGMHRYRDAERYFRVAAELSPEWRYKVNLACALARQGKEDLAERVLEGVLSGGETRAGLSQAFGVPLSPETRKVLLHLRRFSVPWTGLLATWAGHEGSVHAVRFSADGRHALSGSGDGTLRLWDVGSGECVRVLRGHEGEVRAVSFSPEGRQALSGGRDGTLRLWDVGSGECVAVLTGHEAAVLAVGFSAHGKHALSGSTDGTLRVWDIESGKCVRVLGAREGEVRAVSFSPEGRQALSAGRDGTLRLWDTESGKCVRVLRGHEGEVRAVSFSPEGRQALSGGRDGTLRLWDTDSGKCVRVFWGHEGYVHAVSFSPDGRHALSGSGDRTVRLWDTGTGKCIRALEGHAGYVLAVCFSSDGKYALSGGTDASLKLWGPCVAVPSLVPSPGHELARVRRVKDDIAASAKAESLKAMARSLAASKDYGGAFECLRELRRLPGYERDPETLTAASSLGNVAGRRIALRDAWRVITLQTAPSQAGWALEGHTSYVRFDCFLPEGPYVMTGGRDGAVRLWDLRAGKCVAVLEGHGGHVYAVCVSPEGRYAVSGSQDKTVRLWDLRAGKCVAVLEGHGGHVYAVCVSPEGRYAVSGSQDRTVRLWDLRAGKCVAVLEGHGGRVYSASVSPDGRYVLSGGLDGTLVVWELDWDWEFPEPRDWDEGARAYLETFLTLHTLRGPDGTAGRSVPRWQEEDFQQLLSDLGRRGYGWLRPEGVRRKLEDLARRRGLR